MAEQQRVLIIGGNSFVGTNLARDLSTRYSVTCTYRNEVTKLPGVEYIRFNGYAEKDPCKALMQRIEPTVVIYALGSNDIALNEANPRIPQYLHTTAVTHLQSSSEFFKARFIYLSADMLFSGHGGNFAEDDTALPGTALGKAKLGAENFVRSRSLNFTVIRSAPLLGRGSMDHPSWLDKLREHQILGKKMSLSKLMVRNPVHIKMLSDAVIRVIDQDLKNQILHIAGLTKISEYDLAIRVLNHLDLSQDFLVPTETGHQTEATDYSLNFSHSLRVLSTQPLSLNDSLDQLFSH